jgi:exopolyphosphatase/guanosine-5'-triphosphate,3'-diphosphate pyrophosphatase
LELVPARAAGHRRPPYAIVDIGSNSVRLVVYDQLGRAPFPRFNEKSLCRLGDGLAETGALAAEGFRRTVEATRRFRAIAEVMGVCRIDVLATEATRRASNGSRLVAAIAKEAGLKVCILSGREEAYYAALGVVSGFYRPRGLVGDFGGGSLEIAEARDDRVGERSVSMPIGSLPVEAMMERSASAGREEIDALLAARLPAAPAQPVFYAVGGGWRALAHIHLAKLGRPSASSTAMRSRQMRCAPSRSASGIARRQSWRRFRACRCDACPRCRRPLW